MFNYPIPTVIDLKDYDSILQENITTFKTIVPNWEPYNSDEFAIMLQAFAYRELHLRAEFQRLAKAFFLSTATGQDLDDYALRYGIERLKGSMPYATYRFTLSATLASDVSVPAGVVLQDKSFGYKAILLQDVNIKAGESYADGVLELQEYVSKSDVQTTLLTTPLPFVENVEAVESFLNGADVENDESLRDRVMLSIADKSTAGAELTYKSFAHKADKRLQDVHVENGGAGVVRVIYWSEEADELMAQRLNEELNDSKVRPLTDNVQIVLASQVEFSINAQLRIHSNYDVASVYLSSIQALESGLESLKKIKTDITLSEINEFLKVDGVKEVIINKPIENVVVLSDQIGVCSAKTITYTTI